MSLFLLFHNFLATFCDITSDSRITLIFEHVLIHGIDHGNSLRFCIKHLLIHSTDDWNSIEHLLMRNLDIH